MTLWRIETGRVRPLRATALLVAWALKSDLADLFPADREGTP